MRGYVFALSGFIPPANPGRRSRHRDAFREKRITMSEEDLPERSPDNALRRILDLDPKLTALTLLIAAAGGTSFYLAGLPLAWMLGSMTACVLYLLAGGQLVSVKPLRDPWVAVVGITLGTSFQMTIFNDESYLILALVFASMILMAVFNFAYLRFIARLDKSTSFFAGMPGGLYEMVLQSEKTGGDPRTVALLQSIRLFLIVMIVPLGFRLFGLVGSDASTITVAGAHHATAQDYVVMALCAVAGWPLGILLRLPNAPLLGSTLLAGIVHGLGLMNGAPPTVLLAIAQIIIGASIGGQFMGVTVRYLSTTGRHGIPLLLANLMVMFSLAFAATLVTEQPFVSLVLILAPGGLTEMSLLALAIGIDIAFVAFHQVLRLFVVQLVAGPAFRLWTRKA